MGAKRDRRWSTFNPRSTPRMHYAPFYRTFSLEEEEKKKKKRKRKRIYVNLEQTAKLSSLLRRGGLRHCRPNNFHFTGRKYFVRPPFFSPSLSLSLSSSLPFRFENLKAVFPCQGSEGEEGFLSRIRRGGGEFSRGNGKIFQWTIRCRARRWRGTAEGEHLETRHCNYEPYHVGASLVTNSLYCPPFRNWPRVDALYLPPSPILEEGARC